MRESAATADMQQEASPSFTVPSTAIEPMARKGGRATQRAAGIRGKPRFHGWVWRPSPRCLGLAVAWPSDDPWLRLGSQGPVGVRQRLPCYSELS